jgi:hypothetical protein
LIGTKRQGEGKNGVNAFFTEWQNCIQINKKLQHPRF